MHKSERLDLILKLIADTLGMEVSDYKVKTKQREYVNLRFLACYLLRRYFSQDYSLQLIASHMVYDKDHTLVISAIDSVKGYLEVKDEKFMKIYQPVYDAFRLFMKQNKLYPNVKDTSKEKLAYL